MTHALYRVCINTALGGAYPISADEYRALDKLAQTHGLFIACAAAEKLWAASFRIDTMITMVTLDDLERWHQDPISYDAYVDRAGFLVRQTGVTIVHILNTRRSTKALELYDRYIVQTVCGTYAYALDFEQHCDFEQTITMIFRAIKGRVEIHETRHTEPPSFYVDLLDHLRSIAPLEKQWYREMIE